MGERFFIRNEVQLVKLYYAGISAKINQEHCIVLPSYRGTTSQFWFSFLMFYVL